MRNKIARVLWGILLILLGILIMGNTMGWFFYIPNFKGWLWIVILMPCLLSILNHGFRLINTVLAVLSVLSFLEENQLITSGMTRKTWIPFSLMLVGFSMIFRNLFTSASEHYNGDKNVVSMFSSVQESFDGTFDGCEINAIFGTANVDLTSLSSDQKTVIEATSVFGSAHIRVPKGTKVIVHKNCIFGSGPDGRKGSTDGPVLYLNVFCMFGGVSIHD